MFFYNVYIVDIWIFRKPFLILAGCSLMGDNTCLINYLQGRQLGLVQTIIPVRSYWPNPTSPPSHSFINQISYIKLVGSVFTIIFYFSKKKKKKNWWCLPPNCIGELKTLFANRAQYGPLTSSSVGPTKSGLVCSPHLAFVVYNLIVSCVFLTPSDCNKQDKKWVFFACWALWGAMNINNTQKDVPLHPGNQTI